MKFVVHTIQNRGFGWVHHSGVSFKGYVTHRNHFYEGMEAAEFFSTFRDFESVIQVLDDMDGMFSVIIQKQNQVLIAVDPTSTFPLFYNTSGNQITISDDPYPLRKERGLNRENINEFLLTGFTTGRQTFLESVFQTQAAAAIIFGKESITFHPYYTHKVKGGEILADTFETLAKRLKGLLYVAFEDFIKTLKGRPVALSLSGGYDSRLIAYMLRHFGYENVLCFTYGRCQGNEELQNSRKAAERLGYEWRFIKYHSGMAENYLESPVFRDYVKFAGKLSSMPMLVDYFAVQQLKEQSLVSDDTIFLCGHSGDSVAGSHLKEIFDPSDTIKKVVDTIYHSYYNLSRIPERKYYSEKLKREIKPTPHMAYSIFEDWILRERQAKFIVNSACVYDFFGYEYRMPLWDIRLLDFFRKVPLEHKNYKRLYDHVLRELFREKGIAFETELQASNRSIQIQKVKDRIKRYLPTSVIKRFQQKNPWHAYDIFTAPMAAELKGTEYEKRCGSEYNSVICNWYVKKIEEEEF